jgi:hypothetical protein
MRLPTSTEHDKATLLVMSTLMYVHLAALATYLASLLHLLLIVAPCASAMHDPLEQRRFLAREFRVQNPLSIAALGVLLMTGAFRLTDVKARLGPTFFVQVGRPLMLKLMCAFLVINVATYIAFGLAHRLVRAHQGDLPVDGRQQALMLRRLSTAACLALALVLLTIWISVETAPALHRS